MTTYIILLKTCTYSYTYLLDPQVHTTWVLWWLWTTCLYCLKKKKNIQKQNHSVTRMVHLWMGEKGADKIHKVQANIRLYPLRPQSTTQWCVADCWLITSIFIISWRRSGLTAVHHAYSSTVHTIQLGKHTRRETRVPVLTYIQHCQLVTNEQLMGARLWPRLVTQAWMYSMT